MRYEVVKLSIEIAECLKQNHVLHIHAFSVKNFIETGMAGIQFR